MDDTESCNVYGPLATVLRILGVLGIAPLRFSSIRRATRPIHILPIHYRGGQASRKCFIASLSRRRTYLGRILALTIAILQQVLYLLIRLKLSNSHVKFTIALTISSTMITSVLLIVAAFVGITKMKWLISYLNKLEEVGTMTTGLVLWWSSLGADIKSSNVKSSRIQIHCQLKSSYLHQKITKYNIILWLLLSFRFSYCFWIIFNYINNDVEKKVSKFISISSFILNLIYIVKQTMLLLLMLKFTFIVCLVNKTMGVHNERLQNLIYELKLHDSMKIKSATDAHTKIRHIHCIYVSMCDLVRSIDNEEGALLFTLLMCHVYDLIGGVYLIMNGFAYLEEWSYKTIPKIVVLLLAGLFKSACLFVVIEPCHETHQEFQKVQLLVSHLMCASTEKKIKDELSRFYEQCTNNIPVFCPMGIFVLTRKFMVQVFGVIVTFLSITLQFRLMESSN